MKRAMLLLVLFTFGGFLFAAIPAAAQFVPSSKKVDRMEVRQGPEIELNRGASGQSFGGPANNPGGSPEHFAVVHYGTDPKKLNLTAKSHIRLNPSLTTLFSAYAWMSWRRRLPTTTRLILKTRMA